MQISGSNNTKKNKTMANNCNNFIQIEGKEEAINKIENFFKSYKNFDSTEEWGNSVLNTNYEIDERILNTFNKYGARWFDFDLSRDDEQTLTISGDSAWSPMETLTGVICNTFKVSGYIEYEEGGCDFGGRTEFNDKGKIEDYIYMKYREWKYYSEGSEYISEVLAYDLEDCIDDYDNFEEFMEENNYINKEDDINYLKEKFTELKNN